MLVEFKVGNYRSFKDMVTFSMVASADKEYEDTHTIPVNEKLRLLRSTALYGANASGKSNLFKAMKFMRLLVIHSAKDKQAGEPIPVHRFRFSTETGDEAATFEMIFIIDGIRYRYGFQLDEERIHSEWLYYTPTIREATLFVREKGEINVGSRFREGKGVEGMTRPNALFVSVVAQFNGKISGAVLEWFKNLEIISDTESEVVNSNTLLELDNKEIKDFTEKLLTVADTGIKGVEKRNVTLDAKNFPMEIPTRLVELLAGLKKKGHLLDVEIRTIHAKYNRDKQEVGTETLSLINDESSGTNALFALSAPIHDVLKKSGVLVIDELTSKLHPLLTRAVLNMFHQHPSESNAQLIFSGHDTSILTNQYFRRDQVWFTQKDRYGVTDLYSLDDYRVRKDASFNKDYMMGKYGAIPFVGDIDSLFK